MELVISFEPLDRFLLCLHQNVQIFDGLHEIIEKKRFANKNKMAAKLT